jgi:hypothetical protein
MTRPLLALVALARRAGDAYDHERMWFADFVDAEAR